MSGEIEQSDPVRVAVIGGSGLYGLGGLGEPREVEVATPFGLPSDHILLGTLEGSRVAFLARHGRQHSLLPTEVNHRANIFALKKLGVERILSASAVGSMREEIRPRDVVLVDQFIDRTRLRPSTFFGDGLAGHISFADPICPVLRSLLVDSCREAGARYHDGGTYLCIEGPAFSTRAESKLYRTWDVQVIGMTNMQEAKLAREAEICYATLALVTDYDCWHEDEEDVSVSSVLDNLEANADLAADVVRRTLSSLPRIRGGCGCGDALRHGLITAREAVPAELVDRLDPILGRYFGPGDGRGEGGRDDDGPGAG
jgi:5'-methylthioadenosine phosphorylase